MRFWFVGDILRWLLDLVYNIIPNYGWAIIVFVFIIRLCLLPLDIKSRRGMKRMQDVQPQIDYIQKKYANDKDRLNQKMADLYKKEKISPMSGCLPMLIQMPILFAMFAVMREVANERTVAMIFEIKAALEAGITDFQPQLESFLWIKNIFQPDSFWATLLPAANSGLMEVSAYGSLTEEMINEARAFLATESYAEWLNVYMRSVSDASWVQQIANHFGWGTWNGYSAPMLIFGTLTIPIAFNGLFILPILSAVTQLLSSKFMNMNTPAASTEQQKSSNQMMKWFFPLFSLWICSSSNAGFALYWVAANVIQVLQQILINKWIKITDSKKLNEEAGK